MTSSLVKQGAIRVTDWVARISALTLVLLALVTFADVVGRYVFHFPLPGGLEIIQALMAILVYAAIAAATAANEHVRVDLLTPALGPRLRAWLRFFAALLTLAVAAAFTFGMLNKSVDLIETHELTPVLRLPIYPVILAAGLMSVGFSLAAFVRLLDDLQSALSISHTASPEGGAGG
jgi:TRAP-type C4-dicarboxylate transport system permease small subunit